MSSRKRKMGRGTTAKRKQLTLSEHCGFTISPRYHCDTDVAAAQIDATLAAYARTDRDLQAALVWAENLKFVEHIGGQQWF